jgi:O-antigen/teichoic acid export membrane protein
MPEEHIATLVPSAIQPPLGGVALTGAIWTIASAALNKVVTLGGQILLAWLLVPEDMGLMGMAGSYTAIASLLMFGGLGDVLIQRQERFERDVSDVFWLSLIMSLIAGTLVALSAPLGARLFNEPRVALLIVIEALSWPLDGLMTVYGASLRRNLNFKTLASIQLLGGAATTITAVALAYAGMGVLALVLAQVARRFVSLVAMRLAAGKVSFNRPSPNRWADYFRPASWLMVTTFFLNVYQIGPNFVLGIMSDPMQSGYYMWGFGLASQIVFLLSSNMQNVFFPAFSKISDEPERQYRAMDQIARMLSATIAPVCVLQMLTIEPLLRMVFHPRWLPSAPIVWWTSLGLMTQSLMSVTHSLFRARGRFMQLTAIMAFQAIALMLAAAIGAQQGEAENTARACAISMGVTGLVGGWLCYREYNKSVGQLFSSAVTPILLSGISGSLAWGVIQQIAIVSPLPYFALIVFTFLVLYFLLLRAAMPSVIANLTHRIRFVGKARRK